MGVLPPGDALRLIGTQDIEARRDRVPVGRDVPQDECAAGMGVGTRVVERDVEAGAGPGQGAAAETTVEDLRVAGAAAHI